LLASLCGALPANHAAADYALLCTGELSGEGDAVRQGAGGVKFTNVNVAGASDLAQACATVRNDPLYGYYSWKTCVDPNGRGSCANASGPVSSGGPPAEQGIPPAQSTPLGPNQPPESAVRRVRRSDRFLSNRR